jgi:hypothetical protein
MFSLKMTDSHLLVTHRLTQQRTQLSSIDL